MIYLLFMFFVLFVGVYISVWFLLVALSNVDKLHEHMIANYFPTISIIVPAHNEEKYIKKSLESVANLDYPKEKIEVIVVDNGSTDKTFEEARRFKKKFHTKLKKIKLFKLSRPGKSEALNIGIKYASGDIVGILDADTIVRKDCLKKMLPYFKNKKVGAVTNYIKPINSKGFLPSLQALEYIFSSFSKKLISILDALYIIPGTLSLIRKDLIKKIGFSNDTLTEDMDAALCILKSGYKISNCLDAVAYTVVPTTFHSLLKQRIRWYRGFIQNFVKHSDIIFNKEYPHLGYFVLPFSSFLAIFVGASLTLILFNNLFHNAIIFINRFFYIPFFDTFVLFTPQLKNFSISKLFLAPYSTILYSMIFLSSFLAFIIAFRLQKIKLRKKLLLLPFYFFVYYTLIMIFWVISILTEIFKIKKRW